MKEIEKFIEYLKYEKRFSNHTSINYEKDLTDFIEFQNKKVEDIEINDIRKYLKHLYDKKYSNASISRKVSTLKSFFKYLEAENYIKINPMILISNPKKDKKLPSFLNYNDIEKLLNTPDLKTHDGKRDALIIEMLYSTGVRVSELVNIEIKDINTKDQSIIILGKGNKERYAYYGTKCKDLLELYLSDIKTDSPYLFTNKHGNKLNDRIVRTIITNNAKKAGLKIKVTPHTLRHTYATHMLNEGADLKSVSDLLGHENLSTTQIYTHVSNERLRNIYLNSHPRAKKH
ncbi:MAG: tyrosine recombinase XerC [Bacilli bacterium]|nr:tyrosine recombinase XerC [Bacilli bacterium]